MTSLVFRMVRSIGVSLRDDEKSEDGEGCGEPDGEADPCELDESLIGLVELFVEDGDFLLESVSAAVYLVGVGDELGDCFLVLLLHVVSHRVDGHLSLAGLLEECERGFNLCYLAFVLDDASHAVADVAAHVLHALGDGAFEFCKVGSEGFVVVDDCLECGVAVLAAGRAVTLGLGGCHGVFFLIGVGWVVRIVGMDFSTLFSGGSAFAAFVSVFFAGVSWYQSLGSKKAKKKAEEAHQAALEMRDAAVRAAEAAEEHARHMAQIVAAEQKQSESQGKIESHLWRPAFELTWESGETYLLRNVTGESIEVLEVANLAEFFRCNQIQQVFRPGESLRVFMLGVSGMPLPPNLELRISGVDEVVTVPIRR